MSDFWLNCDSCGRQNVGVTFVNGMKFCAKCYQETFGNTNPFEKELRDKIADLEAKLAESGKEITIRNQKLNELKNELHKRDESLQRKKQQVGDVHKAVKQAKRESARKGRQVCIANNEVVQYQKQIKELKQQLAEKEKEIERLKYTVDFYKSYYISFKEKVIDELEKVKELCRKDMTICEDYFAIAKILDNQIEELTHQHEDKGE